MNVAHIIPHNIPINAQTKDAKNTLCLAIALTAISTLASIYETDPHRYRFTLMAAITCLSLTGFSAMIFHFTAQTEQVAIPSNQQH